MILSRHPGMEQKCNRISLNAYFSKRNTFSLKSKSLFESPSEPPETHIDDECDEEHRHRSYLGIRGAGVEVFGITAVLLRQGGQIAGFCV